MVSSPDHHCLACLEDGQDLHLRFFYFLKIPQGSHVNKGLSQIQLRPGKDRVYPGHIHRISFCDSVRTPVLLVPAPLLLAPPLLYASPLVAVEGHLFHFSTSLQCHPIKDYLFHSLKMLSAAHCETVALAVAM